MASVLLCKYFPNLAYISSRIPVFKARNIASSEGENKIVTSDDGQTIVCWHPEMSFPYENSLPINVTKKFLSDSVLKVQSVQDDIEADFNKKPEVVRQRLMQMTFTTKHRWFPESVHKRRRRRPVEMNRPFL